MSPYVLGGEPSLLARREYYGPNIVRVSHSDFNMATDLSFQDDRVLYVV